MPDHDPSYKLLFSHRDLVADLIRGFVQEDWVAQLDFTTLQRVSEITVSHDLREREDDMIWRLRWGERWVYVYLLLNVNNLQEMRAMLAERVKTWTEEWKQQGISEGEIKLLRRLLVRRFGSLPAWAEARLEQAGEDDLEVWADRVLDGTTLEEVLKEPI